MNGAKIHIYFCLMSQSVLWKKYQTYIALMAEVLTVTFVKYFSEMLDHFVRNSRCVSVDETSKSKALCIYCPPQLIHLCQPVFRAREKHMLILFWFNQQVQKYHNTAMQETQLNMLDDVISILIASAKQLVMMSTHCD